MKISDKNNILLFISFLIFCIITLKTCNFHVSGLFRDESHAWTIAQYCSLPQLFDLMKVEGHMLLWYLVLMPFAKLKLWYPHTLVYLNWIFCAGALICVINSKKIHIITKITLLFSPMFVSMYAIYARCYSIGFLFLFLACAYYKERLKHPYIYFLILFLAANTSILAAIAASGLGLIFLYDLYREKRENNQKLTEFFVIIGLTILTGIVYYFQFFPVQIPNYEQVFRNNSNYSNIVRMFFGYDYIGGNANLIIIGIVKIFAIISVYLFSKNGKILFLFLYTMLISSALFIYIYTPYEWHLGFYLIYLFVCYWIFMEENSAQKVKIYLSILVTLIIALTYALPFNYRHSEMGFLYRIINNSTELRHAKLFTDIAPIYLCSVLPFLNNEDIYIYDVNNINLSFYEGLEQYYLKKEYNYGELPNYLDKEKENYIISSNDLTKDKNYQYIKLKLYKKEKKLYIYKILKNLDKT